MKCSALKRGTAAVKEVEFTTLDGAVAKLGLRALLGDDEALAVSRAIEYAEARGAKDPRDGHPLYELGKAVHLVAIAAVDLDAPSELFFDRGWKQVVETLDTERIFVLKEQQRAHQEESSPSPMKMGTKDFIEAVYACAEREEGAELPFEYWHPVMRRSFVRTLAVMCVTSLSDKSPTGLGSSESTGGAPASS